MDKIEEELFILSLQKIFFCVAFVLILFISYVSLLLGARAEIEKVDKEYPGAHELAVKIIESTKE